MKSTALALSCLALAGCAAPAERSPEDMGPPLQPSSSGGPVDDGTYLERIDPVGGQWRVERIGESDFARWNAWVNFSEGGFLNHGAGCSGGYPAFYRLEGERITITRREPIRTGKCAGTAEMANGPAAVRQAAADSERRLASFLDQLSGWTRQGDTLVLTAGDGTRASLTRPAEPHPEIAGRWLIESIDGEALVTERRPATLSIAMGGIGAHADCNSFGGQFTIAAPGRIAVGGPLISTAIGCAAEDAAEDALMARAITRATAYRLDGERLIFTGGPGMVVRRPPPPDRRLAGEYQHCGNTLLGAYHEGPVSLAIAPQTMTDNAGCTARYAANGPNLSLQLDDSPACGGAAPPYVPGEPVGVGGDISTLSVTRPNGFGFNEQGQLILRTGRGLLTMCRKGAPLPFGS
jgi:heat shock protein HslJ